MTDTNSDKRVLSGARFDVHEIELQGSDGKKYVREVVRHPGAVVLLPLIDRDHVVMIANYRATVGETLLELPAGTREPNEKVEVTAARELMEETGFRAGRLTKLHEFYSAPGICDELMHLYLAEDLTEGEHAREATEEIENRVTHRDEILASIESGTIRDAKTLIGLYAYLSMP